jgi:ATP/maltotriose-dependent transcriptional regulator MalT/DNA-binding SARP family transcriptional activator
MLMTTSTIQGRSARAHTIAPWKHAPPRLAEALLPREHLIQKLEQCLARRQRGADPYDVFFVDAPAGYGKTTLLAQWAAQTAVPVTWYHVDASDNDPVVFLRGLVHALRAKTPRSVWQVDRLLGKIGTMRSASQSALDLQRALELLFADLRQNLARRPHVLILTGISILSQQGGQTLLSDLLSRPADNLRLVLECREHPEAYVAQLIAQRRINGLSAADLSLRSDEFTMLLQQAGVSDGGEQAHQLEALCGGWITGMLLATGTLLPHFLQSCSSDVVDQERVVEYLSREVIDRLPPALCDFAMEAAVLDPMTPQLCAELLEIPAAREHLVALEQRTGFMTRIGRQADDAHFRFQPFLRQALLARLDACHDGQEYRHTLHERAGRILEDNGDYQEAVQQYALGRNFVRVIELIEARRGALLRSGEGATLARWIDLLPAPVQARTPWLQVLRAELFRQTGQTDEAEAAVEQLAAAPRLVEKEPQLAAELLVLQGHLAIQAGRNEEALQRAKLALKLVSADAGELRVRSELLLVSATLFAQGPRAALTQAEAITTRCAAIRDLWALASLHYLRSKMFLIEGMYDEAEASATAALLTAEEATDDVTAVNARLNLGAIALRTQRITRAREQFENAQALSIAAGYARGEAYALTNLADLYMTSGAYAEAAEAYKRAWHAVTVLKSGDVHLRAATARNFGVTLALLGQTARAIELLGPEVEMFGSRGHDLNWIDLTIALGFAKLRAGAYVRAHTLLTEASARAKALDATLKMGRARFYLAAVELNMGRPEQAHQTLEMALTILATLGGPDVVLFEAKQLPELQPLLAEMSDPLARGLSARLADVAPAPSARELTIGTQPPMYTLDGEAEEARDNQVRLFALGEPRVLVGSERIRTWRKPGVRDLLFFLAEQGSASTEQILTALWPDEDPAKSKALFREARSRLKSALGVGECLVRDGTRWQLTIEYWSDIQEFARLLGEGGRLAAQDEFTAAATALRQALTYWTGSYLDDIYIEWPLQRRDELQRHYHGALELLANLELRLGHLDEAAQHYYQLIEAEPYHEGAHRGLMRYFARRHEIGRALDQFQNFAHRLDQELGVQPSQETLELYQALRDKAKKTGTRARLVTIPG